jgi:outer membrane protein
MRIIKFWVFLAILCFSVAGSRAQEVQLTLKQVINSAIKSNINVLKNQDAIDAQESNIKATYGSLIPTLSFSHGVSRSNQINQGSINLNGVNVDVGTQNQTTNNFSLSLRSDVTLFDGFSNYERIDLAKMTRTKYYTQLEKAKQDIVVKLLADYITVLKNSQIVKINQATLEDAQAQLDKVKIFVEVGKRTMSDIYRQDVIVAQSELAVEQAKNNTNKSIADLAFDANLSLDKTYTVNQNEFPTEYAYETLQNYVDRNSYTEQLVSIAVKNRYDYKSSQQNIEILKGNLELTRNQLLFPTLSGFSSYSLSGDKYSTITDSRVFTVGLTLSYPILQGFSVENQRQQAIINLRMADEDLVQLRSQITLDIKKSILDLRSLLKQIEITDRTLKSAEQDKMMAEESYRVGIGTLLDVNTAALKYNNALIDKSNTIYNFILAQKQLEYYQGLLKY